MFASTRAHSTLHAADDRALLAIFWMSVKSNTTASKRCLASDRVTVSVQSSLQKLPWLLPLYSNCLSPPARGMLLALRILPGVSGPWLLSQDSASTNNAFEVSNEAYDLQFLRGTSPRLPGYPLATPMTAATPSARGMSAPATSQPRKLKAQLQELILDDIHRIAPMWS